MVAAAVVGAAVVGGVSSSIAADKQADAAKDAANAEVQAARESNQLQRDLFNAQAGLTEFQRGIGNQALAQLGGLYGLQGGYNPAGTVRFDENGDVITTPGGPAPVNQGVADYSAFFNSPDYQFALQQGQRGLDRQQAARGNLFSGGAAREASRFNQGLASQQFGNYANRLSNLAGIGTQGTNTLANALQTTGTNIGQGLVNAGNARASGYIGQGNAAAAGISGVSNSLSSALGAYTGYGGFGGGGGAGYQPTFMNSGNIFG